MTFWSVVTLKQSSTAPPQYKPCGFLCALTFCRKCYAGSLVTVSRQGKPCSRCWPCFMQLGFCPNSARKRVICLLRGSSHSCLWTASHGLTEGPRPRGKDLCAMLAILSATYTAWPFLGNVDAVDSRPISRTQSTT